MPFSELRYPSIALTQLKSVVFKELGDQVSIDILYLNYDFAYFLGLDAYNVIAESYENEVTGMGDWLFRKLAFPELSDNSEEYFHRYFQEKDKKTEILKYHVLKKWHEADRFLDELIDKYQLEQVDLVGFTSMFSQSLACFTMAKKLKERNSNIVAVMGGANCEWPMGWEIVRNVEHIDFVFSGPALKTFPRFLKHCLNQQMENCCHIEGVLGKINGIPQLPPSVFGEDLPIDVEVELDYESFLNTLERNFPNGEIEPVLLFETSRGCWWGERSQCTFCGLNGMTINYWAMSPNKAISLFQSLFKYSSKVQVLEGVDNIMPKNYLKEVFPMLNTPPNMCIFYQVKADLAREDMEVLFKGGARLIQPGIESLATSTLKLIRKGTTAFQNLIFLKNCLLSDILPSWNLLVGFPGEDENVYKKYRLDIPQLIHLPPPTGVYPVRFDRFSPYYVQAQEYGVDLYPMDFYSFIYPFDEAILSNIAYYFEDRNTQAPYRVEMTKWIKQLREEIEYWRVRWFSKNQLPRPKLYFERDGKSTVVYDSRSEKVIRHEVGYIGKRVLEYLIKPRGITDIASVLSDIPDFNLEREVAFLQSNGLIFQEGDRFISLVLPKKTLLPYRKKTNRVVSYLKGILKILRRY